MAKKKKTTKRRYSYRAPARRAKAAAKRTYRRASTAAKRTYRKTRSNPKGLLKTPAVRFGLAAGGSVVLASMIKNPGSPLASLQYELTEFGGVSIGTPEIAGVLLLVYGMSKMGTAANRQLAAAAGVGMLVPAVSQGVQSLLQPAPSTDSLKSNVLKMKRAPALPAAKADPYLAAARAQRSVYA